LSRSSAPPLRIRLRTDPFLPAAGRAGLWLAALAVPLYALLQHAVWLGFALLPVGVGLALWLDGRRAPRWDWLGCDAEGQWWLATQDGLRREERERIQPDGRSRVGARLVVLAYRREAGRGLHWLWLPCWTLEPEDFRRLRVRLRWPPVPLAGMAPRPGRIRSPRRVLSSRNAGGSPRDDRPG
jgi:toxin CptA